MDGSADWEKTSLKPYIDLLDKHALSLMEEVRKEKRKTGNLHFVETIFDRHLIINTDMSW